MAEREMSFERLRADLSLVDDYQRAVFERQLEVEQRAAKTGFVSDRAFDNLAYAARHSTILPELLGYDSTVNYFNTMRKSLVFFVRPQRALMVHDGVRESGTWEEVIRIDGIIDYLLAAQSIPAIGIGELGLRNRLRTAMSAVSHYQRGLKDG